MQLQRTAYPARLPSLGSQAMRASHHTILRKLALTPVPVPRLRHPHKPCYRLAGWKGTFPCGADAVSTSRNLSAADWRGFTSHATLKLRVSTRRWTAAPCCPPQPFGLARNQPSILLSAVTGRTRQSRPRRCPRCLRFRPSTCERTRKAIWPKPTDLHVRIRRQRHLIPTHYS